MGRAIPGRGSLEEWPDVSQARSCRLKQLRFLFMPIQSLGDATSAMELCCYYCYLLLLLHSTANTEHLHGVTSGEYVVPLVLLSGKYLQGAAS